MSMLMTIHIGLQLRRNTSQARQHFLHRHQRITDMNLILYGNLYQLCLQMVQFSSYADMLLGLSVELWIGWHI